MSKFPIGPYTAGISVFPKNRLLVATVALISFSLQAGASELLYSANDIELRWEAAGSNSSSALARYQGRAAEIAEFYRSRVLPSVPAALWKGEKAPFVSVLFRSDLPTDGGLFVPPSSQSHTITRQIHSPLVLSGDSERTFAH